MKKYRFFAILFLFIGLYIYLFYRTEKTVINCLVIDFVSHEKFESVKTFFNSILPLNDFIIYSLPEGMWVFFITLLSQDVYLRIADYKINCVVLPLIFSVGLEFFQLLNITNGIFDWTDIFCSVLFWFLAFYIGRKNKNSFNESEKNRIKSISVAMGYAIVFLSDVWV